MAQKLKTKQVHITMDPRDLKRIDKQAKAKGLSRSSLIRLYTMERVKEEEE